ncbi:MFS transporter [Herbaspirillum sp. B65]|uniref:MFS transporter n=1 Tax=Herbaspirillum sp. B65 TaxID=137708 RepID=UPI0003450BEA|nr:MFS transporter [Herbaspirillum sp. B65]
MQKSVAAARLPASERPTHERYFLALILMLVVVFSYIDRVNVSILIVDNAFLHDMGITGQALQKGMLMSVFLVAYSIGNVLLSPLGDVLGPRKGMMFSIVVWGISLIIGGLAPTFVLMLFSRVLLGLGEGMHFPMQSKFIKCWFPITERGKANAAWNTGLAIAPAIAMPLFTWLIAVAGWRESFFVLAAAGMIPMFLLWRFTADTPRDSKRINQAELAHIEKGLAGDTVATDSDTGFLAKFRSFTGNYRFWLIVIYYMAHASVLWGTMSWVPSYLKTARGFSWEAMGMLSSLPWILGVGTKILSGYLCDKMKRRAPLLVFAMIGVSVGIYLGVNIEDNLTSALVLGFGIGCIGLGGPAAWTLLQDIVPSKGISSAAGMMNGMGNVFSSIAPIAIGYLISLTGRYSTGLYYIIGCCVMGGIATLILTIKKN